MPFLMIRNDITKVNVDVIVNPSNVDLLEGSGTSRAIFLSAGERKLARACRKIKKCKVGEAVITDAFDLSSKYVIHAAGPVWQGGKHDEEKMLYHTYQSSLHLALKKKCESIAFPLLSSGNYGFPKDKAMRTAVSAFNDFLLNYDMMIYLVLYDKDSFSVGQRIFSDIEEYIDDHYVEENCENFPEYEEKNLSRLNLRDEGPQQISYRENNDFDFTSVTMEMPVEEIKNAIPSAASIPPPSASQRMAEKPASLFRSIEPKKTKRSLDDLINNMDETFSQMLLRLIDERGLKDSVVYRKANIDRRHFSKIRNNINYLPKKRTVYSFAIALELSMDETKDLMNKAGYSVSNSSKFDVILSYFLENEIYDIFEINEVLFAYEEPILGS